MSIRAVILAAVIVSWLIWNQSIASAAPTPTGESIVVLNQQIATMIRPTIAPRPVQPLGLARHSAFDGFSPRLAVDQRQQDWLSNPTFLSIAARFTSAERILHYRNAGFDANFWGVLNHGRGIRVRFSVRL
jgi:hypothetical protein